MSIIGFTTCTDLPKIETETTSFELVRNCLKIDNFSTGTQFPCQGGGQTPVLDFAFSSAVWAEELSYVDFFDYNSSGTVIAQLEIWMGVDQIYDSAGNVKGACVYTGNTDIPVCTSLMDCQNNGNRVAVESLNDLADRFINELQAYYSGEAYDVMLGIGAVVLVAILVGAAAALLAEAGVTIGSSIILGGI